MFFASPKEVRRTTIRRPVKMVVVVESSSPSPKFPVWGCLEDEQGTVKLSYYDGYEHMD